MGDEHITSDIDVHEIFHWNREDTEAELVDVGEALQRTGYETISRRRRK